MCTQFKMNACIYVDFYLSTVPSAIMNTVFESNRINQNPNNYLNAKDWTNAKCGMQQHGHWPNTNR